MDIINTRLLNMKPPKHKKINQYEYISYDTKNITPYNLNYKDNSDFYKEFEEVFMKIEDNYYDLYYPKKDKDVKELIYSIFVHADTRNINLKIECKLFCLNDNYYLGYNKHRYWIIFRKNSDKLEILKIFDKDYSIKKLLNELSFDKEFDDSLLTEMVESFEKNYKIEYIKQTLFSKEELIEQLKKNELDYHAKNLEPLDLEKEKILSKLRVNAYYCDQILNKKIEIALEKVEGINSDEEIHNHYKEKLDLIPELTSKDKKNILKTVVERFNAPKPNPDDYFFKLNMELTNNSTMRGEHTPIFQFKVNKEGKNKGKFGLSELYYILNNMGFSVVSNNVFSWEKGLIKDELAYRTNGVKSEPGDAEIARKILLDYGFIEKDFEDTIIRKQSNKEINSEDFLNRLFGNGTSTNEATESFGKKAYNDGFPDIEDEEEMGSYIGIKEKAICLDSTKFTEAEYEKCNKVIKKALEKYKDKKIEHAYYTGYKERDISVINSAEDNLDYECCINIKELSKIHNENNYSYVLTRTNSRYWGYAVLKTSEGCRIIRI